MYLDDKYEHNATYLTSGPRTYEWTASVSLTFFDHILSRLERDIYNIVGFKCLNRTHVHLCAHTCARAHTGARFAQRREVGAKEAERDDAVRHMEKEAQRAKEALQSKAATEVELERVKADAEQSVSRYKNWLVAARQTTKVAGE